MRFLRLIREPVLLDQLVSKKLEKTAKQVAKEGWKWVEVRPAFDYAEWSKCQRRYGEPVPLPPASTGVAEPVVSAIR